MADPPVTPRVKRARRDLVAVAADKTHPITAVMFVSKKGEQAHQITKEEETLALRGGHVYSPDMNLVGPSDAVYGAIEQSTTLPLERIKKIRGRRGRVTWLDSYRHFYSFSENILDRLALWSGAYDDFEITVHGREHMQRFLAGKNGRQSKNFFDAVYFSETGTAGYIQVSIRQRRNRICGNRSARCRFWKLNLVVHCPASSSTL